MPLDHALTGVFVGSHAIAAGLITRERLRTSGFRRVVHGVHADPSLPFDHELRSRGVALGELRALPIGAGRRWGVRRVRRAVELVAPRAESPPE
ncbi:hypothetical protein [Geodermatophilus sp. SYSU D00815]